MSKPQTPKELYHIINFRYFRSKLPDIPVGWSAASCTGKHRRMIGGTEFKKIDGVLKPTRIMLNPKYKTCFVLWVGTLIHEMVHVEQWKLPRKQAHGRKFEKRIRQLVSLGAYKGLL